MAKQVQTKIVQSSLIAAAVLGVVVGFYTGYVRAESYKCPVPEITVGADTCTSRGCRLYKGTDRNYGPWAAIMYIAALTLTILVLLSRCVPK
jgi:hypothetical protein